jgi:hypothetical protein
MVKQQIQIDENGVIIYEREPIPAPPLGWLADESGLRFVPPWKPCFYRRINRNPITGAITPACRKQPTTPITTQTCCDCLIRTETEDEEFTAYEQQQKENLKLVVTEPLPVRDGFLEVSDQGWEPPKELDGFTRCSDNPFRFKSEWPPCQERQLDGQKTRCGHLTVIATCHRLKNTVNKQQCQSCTERKDEE